MIINGKDVDNYYESHSIQQVNTVVQTLQVFGLHRELELYLKNGKYKRRFEPEPVDALELRLKEIPAPCPKCGARVRGTNRVGCAGRRWYEECTICPYYREEFGGS